MGCNLVFAPMVSNRRPCRFLASVRGRKGTEHCKVRFPVLRHAQLEGPRIYRTALCPYQVTAGEEQVTTKAHGPCMALPLVFT